MKKVYALFVNNSRKYVTTDEAAFRKMSARYSPFKYNVREETWSEGSRLYGYYMASLTK